MKKHNRYMTPDGKGTYTGDIDQPLSKNPRYGIILDGDPFSYPIAYYRKDELTKIK